jgi:hypothetical protein
LTAPLQGPSPSPASERAPGPAADEAGDASGDATGHRAGDAAGHRAGDAAGQHAGDAAGQHAPTDTAPDGHRPGRTLPRRAWPWLAVVGFVGLLWLIGAPATTSTQTDSPASSQPDGAKGLATLVSQLGTQVDTSGALPPVGHGVALVLADHLGTADRQRLLTWVRTGGVLVVADPTSPLEQASPAPGHLPNTQATASGPLAPDCAQPWVAGVTSIDDEADPLLAPSPGTGACFGAGGAAFAVEQPDGRGAIVSLGGPELWQNSQLDQADNALLAANLLAPGPGTTLAWLVQGVRAGQTTLWSVTPTRVKLSLLLALVAAVVVVAWRARRLGRPVIEAPVVPLPGSELVAATGRLQARRRQTGWAGAVLRGHALATAQARAGVHGAEPAAVAEVLAGRFGLDREQTLATLSGPDPANEEELVGLAQAVERIRGETN